MLLLELSLSYVCHKRKTRINNFLNCFFLVASKTSQNLNISCTFMNTIKSCPSSNLKKEKNAQKCMSYMPLKANLHTFQI